MPFCRECGKEIQEDWVACPYCRIDMCRSGNRFLWNIVIIASTLLVLLWPSGLGDLSLLDRAFVDCSDDIFVTLNLEDGCQDWRGEGRFILLLVLSIFASLLMINNRSHKHIADDKNKQKEQKFHLEALQKEWEEAAEKRKIELENRAARKGFKSVKEMQNSQRASALKLLINVLMTAIIFTIAFYPYIDTHNVDTYGWYVGDTSVSFHEVATCSTYEEIEGMYTLVGDSKVVGIYCPSESYRDEYRIPYFLMIIGYIALLGLTNWKTLSDYVGKKSSDNSVPTEEE